MKMLLEIAFSRQLLLLYITCTGVGNLEIELRHQDPPLGSLENLNHHPLCI